MQVDTVQGSVENALTTVRNLLVADGPADSIIVYVSKQIAEEGASRIIRTEISEERLAHVIMELTVLYTELFGIGR